MLDQRHLFNILVIILILLIVDDIRLTYRYYKKLDAKEKKKYCKEIGIIGVINLITWSILLYDLFNITDIVTLCAWSLIITGLTLFRLTNFHRVEYIKK